VQKNRLPFKNIKEIDIMILRGFPNFKALLTFLNRIFSPPKGLQFGFLKDLYCNEQL
jgi:hypothetical protein